MPKTEKGTIAGEVRQLARNILTEHGNHMKIGELKKMIEQKLGRELRGDHFRNTITADRSRMEVANGLVIFTGPATKKVAKKTTTKKRMAKKTARQSTKKIRRKKAVKNTPRIKKPVRRRQTGEVISSSGRRLSVLDFVLRAIKKLSKPPHKGLHVVYSGFNAAFNLYFPDLNVRKEIDRLIAEEKLHKIPARGGIIIMPGPAPTASNSTAAESQARKTLDKMGL